MKVPLIVETVAGSNHTDVLRKLLRCKNLHAEHINAERIYGATPRSWTALGLATHNVFANHRE